MTDDKQKEPTQEQLEKIALAIGFVVCRGPVAPRKGWLEAARAAYNVIMEEKMH